MFRLFFFLIMCSFSLSIYAQGERFEALPSSEKVYQNSRISISFKYSGNKEVSDFKEPDFSPFRAVSSPGIARSSTIINGVVSNEYRYTYTLITPEKTGKYIIPPATIKAGGKQLISNSVEIFVEKIDPGRLKELEEEAFIEIQLSKETAYIGEPVKMEVRLYYRKYNIDNLNVVGQLNYENFISESLISNRYSSSQVEVNGHLFYVQSLGARILYPRKTGPLSLGELTIQANQILKSESLGFFRSNTEVRPIQLKSKEVILNVIDIPRPAPDDFIGAIGKVEGEMKISKTNLKIGDSFTIWTSIYGASDINRISFPQYTLGNSFESYEPKVVREDSDVSEHRISNIKIFEQIFIAREEGRVAFNPGFSYFDTDLEEYVRISRDFDIVVSGGGGLTTTSILSDDDDQAGSVSLLSWLAVGILSLLVLGTFLYFRKRGEKDFEKINIVSNKVKSSDERLSSAVKFLNDEREKEFYDEVYRLWNEFVIVNCSLPQADLNRNSLKAALIKNQVPADIVEKLESILKICDLSLYGKMDKSDEMSNVVLSCEAVLKDLDEHFRNKGTG